MWRSTLGRSRSEPTVITASSSWRRLRGPALLGWLTDPEASDKNAPMTVRVFLLDDHEIVRRGLKELLEGEEDLVVVGEAGTAAEALARIPAAAPHVAVLDVRLP